MFGKHSLGLQVRSVICLVHWVLFIPQFFCATTTCPPPDFPEGGSYKPEKSEYEVGSRIRYTCKDRLTMFGADRATCQSNGRWSGKTPVCDSPADIKNPIASSRVDLNSRPSAVTDGSPTTCYRTKNGTEEYVKVFLDRPAAVYAVRMYLPKGKNSFKIILSQTTSATMGHRLPTKAVNCQTHQREMAESEWVRFICEDNDFKADYIIVQVLSGTAIALHLCEIEVYSRDDEWCRDPTENFIPNGQLEVSRNKAILHCYEGFKEKDNRRIYATCESNKWSRLLLQCIEILCDPTVTNISQSEGEWYPVGKITKVSVGTKFSLKCKPDYIAEGTPLTVTCHKNGNWTRTSGICIKDKPQKDYKLLAIVIGTVVVLIIFILLGLTIFLIQRKKAREVVVIYKPGENNSYSTPPSVGGQSIAGLSEAEYSTVYYESIQGSQHDPRAPPPKPPNFVPKLERGYSKPVDDRSHYVNTGTPTQLPLDLAFGTLTKSSSLYNTMN